MPEVKVLIEGYAKEIKEGWKANSTVTLIIANAKKMIVDPGCNREKLMTALTKEKLELNDIDYILLTHNHPDHALLSGIFENADIVDEFYIYHGDDIKKHNGKIPGTEVKVIRTPGHKEEHCSFAVPTSKGTYVVAGDVFWWTENQEQDLDVNAPDNDPEHQDQQKLIESRKKLLDMADWIIPGHGKMFKVKK